MTLTKAVTELLSELQREDLTEEEKKALEKYQHWLFGIKKTASNGTDWHPYPQETPPGEKEEYLVTIKYEKESIVRIATYTERSGLELDESGEDYWTAQDIQNGDAYFSAWAELPQPYEG